MKVQISERPNGSRRVRMSTVGKSMCEQSHRSEVNINTIIAKYKKTGLFPQRKSVPTYGDFTGVGDYHECVDRVRLAEFEFQMIPSEIRKRFKNDVGIMLAWLNDPANADEAREIGLLPPVHPGHPPVAEVKKTAPEPTEKPEEPPPAGGEA